MAESQYSRGAVGDVERVVEIVKIYRRYENEEIAERRYCTSHRYGR